MRTRLILIAAAGALVGTLALAPPAEAGHLDWSFGVAFHVDGLHFRIGLAPTGYHGHPGPYFLTTHRLHYRGFGCHDACFRRGAGYYHHASCPLLGFHFNRFGYGPDYFLRGYAPYRGYGRGWAPPHRYRYYRHDHRYGWRDRYRSPGGHYYRDRHHRDHHYRGRGRGHRDRGHDHRFRHDRGRRDFDHDHDGDRRRDYRDDRRGRRDRGREHARPRRGARHTRPPR